MTSLLFQGGGSGGPEPPNHALIGSSPSRFDGPRLVFLDGCGPSADLDPTRLHGLRHPAHQVDMKKPVVERRSLDFDVVGEAEIALERPCRDALVNIILLAVVTLGASDGQPVLLRRDGDLLGVKPASASDIR
jgi:hypothetical protein